MKRLVPNTLVDDGHDFPLSMFGDCGRHTYIPIVLSEEL